MVNLLGENKEINEKLGKFMQEVRERKKNAKYSEERYKHLKELMKKNEEYLQEEVELLRRRVESLRKEKRKLAKLAARKSQENKEQSKKAKGDEETLEKLKELKEDMSLIAKETVNKIRGERDASLEMNEQLRTKLESMTEENAAYRIKFKEVDTKLREWSEDNNYVYKNLLASLDELITEAEKNQRKLEEKKDIEIDYEHLKKQYSTILTKKKKYEDEYHLTKNTLDQVQNDLETCRQDLLTLKAESSESIDILTKQKSESVNKLQMEKDDLTKFNSRVLANNARLEKSNELLQSKYDQILLTKDQLEVKIGYLSSLVKIEKEGKREPASLTINESEKLELTLSLKDKEKELDHYKRKVQNLKQKITSLKITIETKTRQLERSSTSARKNPKLKELQATRIEIIKPEEMGSPLVHRSKATNGANSEAIMTEFEVIKERYKNLEIKFHSLSGELWKQERENRGLREINSQLRESYEKSTGNRNHTPIPSYATVMDKEQTRGMMKKSDSFEGFDDESDDDMLDVHEVNQKLNEDVRILKGKMKGFEERNLRLEKDVEILEKNDKEMNEQILKDGERIRELELMIENGQQPEAAVLTQEMDCQVDSETELELKKTEDIVNKLQQKIDQLRISLKSSQNEQEQFKMQITKFKEVTSILNAQKQYLITLLRSMDGEIQIGGFDLANTSDPQLDDLILKISIAKKHNPLQGKLYEVIRTTYNFEQSSPSKQNDKEENKKPGHRRWISRGSFDGNFEEIQKMTLAMMDLENKLEEMKIKEDKVKNCLIENLKNIDFGSEYLNKEKDRFIEELSMIPEEEGVVEGIEPILGSIDLIFDFLAIKEDQSQSRILDDTRNEEKKIVSDEEEGELILKILEENRDHQSRMSQMLEAYVKRKETVLESDQDVHYLLKLNAMLKK
jgi:hypothetical protein